MGPQMLPYQDMIFFKSVVLLCQKVQCYNWYGGMELGIILKLENH